MDVFLSPLEQFQQKESIFRKKQKKVFLYQQKIHSITFREAQELLTESDFFILAKWIKFLGSSRKKLYYPLLEPFKSHWHFEVRAALANALGLTQDTRGLPILRELLSDSSLIVQWEAKCALIQLRIKEALPYYHSFLQDSYAAIKLLAAEALGKKLDAANNIPLQSAYKGAGRSVKVGIMSALAKNLIPSGLSLMEDALVRDQQPEIKATAILHLSRFPKESYIELFKPSLRSSSLLLVLAAIQGIKNLGYNRGVLELKPLINDKRTIVRAAVARAYGEIGGYDEIPNLLHLLKDSSSRVRAEAAKALGKLKFSEAVPLLTQLTKDSSRDVRSSIAFALYIMDERGIIDPSILQESIKVHLYNLDSGDIYERREALENLMVFQDLSSATKLIAGYLTDHDMEIRVLAIKALALNDALSIEKELQQVFDDPEMMVRWELVYNFADAAKESFKDGFTQLLTDPDPSIRIKAAQYFSNSPSALPIEVLAAKVLDKDPIVRWYVLLALLQSKHPASIIPLKALLPEKTGDLSFWAAVGLAQFQEKEALPYLLQHLYHPTEEIRLEAARAIALFTPSPAYVGRIYHALQDTNLEIRRNISFALTRYFPASDCGVLLNCLSKEHDLPTFQHLVQILRKLEHKEVLACFLKLLQSSHPLRSALIAALLEKPLKKELPLFLSLLQDQDAKTRREVAFCLAEQNWQSSFQALAKYMEGETDPETLLSLLTVFDRTKTLGLQEILPTYSNHPNLQVQKLAKKLLKKRSKKSSWFV